MCTKLGRWRYHARACLRRIQRCLPPPTLSLPASLPPWAPPQNNISQTQTSTRSHPAATARASATNLDALSPTHPSITNQTSCTLWARQSYRGQPPSVTQRRLTRASSFPLPASAPAPIVEPLTSHHHQGQHRSADRSTIARPRILPPQRDHPPSIIILSSPGLAISSHKTAPHPRAAAPTLAPAPPPAPPAQDAKTATPP